MTDPYNYFTPASSLDESYSRSYDSSGSSQRRSDVQGAAYSSHSQSTDFYSPAKGGYGLRQRVNAANSYAYNTDLQIPDDSKKSPLFSRKVVQRIDMFPKIDRDLTVKSDHGAMNTRIGMIIVGILFLAEWWSWSQANKRTIEHVVVDTSLGKKMRVDLNITFPSLHCDDLHIDLMDVAGDVHNDVEETMVKRRLGMDGRYINTEEIRVSMNAAHDKDKEKQRIAAKGLDPNYCGPCYGASEDPERCCQSCDDVLEMYKSKGWETVTIKMLAEQCIREGKNEIKRMSKGEGCNIAGYMVFNRVNGNFHIAMGEGVERDGNHIHTFQPDDTQNFNSSHVIHELRFGPTYGMEYGDLKGLNGVTKIVKEEDGVTGLFQYFIKIVPTTYKGAALVKSLIPDHLGAKSAVMPTLETNRYFTMERFRPLILDIEDDSYDIASIIHGSDTKRAGVHAGGKANHHHKVTQAILPGVFFIYQVYPFAIEVTRDSVPMTHLLIRLMAVTGGVFTLLKVYDGFQLWSPGKR